MERKMHFVIETCPVKGCSFNGGLDCNHVDPEFKIKLKRGYKRDFKTKKLIPLSSNELTIYYKIVCASFEKKVK